MDRMDTMDLMDGMDAGRREMEMESGFGGGKSGKNG